MSGPRGAFSLTKRGWAYVHCAKCGGVSRELRHHLRRTTAAGIVCGVCHAYGADVVWGDLWIDDYGGVWFMPETNYLKGQANDE